MGQDGLERAEVLPRDGSAKPGNLCSIPEDAMVKEKNRLPQIVLDIYTHSVHICNK